MLPPLKIPLARCAALRWIAPVFAFAFVWQQARADMGVTISIDGRSSGATITRSTGGSVSVTVRTGFSGGYWDYDEYWSSQWFPNGQSNARINVWNSTTSYFDNSLGDYFVASYDGEITRTVTMGTDGDWYFWTDGWSDRSDSCSTPTWGDGFLLHIISPPATTLSASTGSPAAGADFTVTAATTGHNSSVTVNAIDYSTDGGTTWTSGTTGAGTRWEGSSGSNTITPTFNFSAVGTVNFRARGQDAAGNLSAYAYTNVTTVDGTAPSTPGSLSASSNTTGSSFTLNWGASSDNVAVTAYEVKRDSTSLGTTTGTSMSITGLSEITAYSMTVRARDAAGNWSSWSSALSVTTADVTAPSTPGSLSATSNTTGTSFTLNWGASSDNVAVTAYEVKRDSTSLGTTTGTSMNLTGLSQATAYSMTVRARDAAGNWSSWSSALSVTTADTTVPTIPTGLSAGSITTTGFTLSWTASTDNVGVTAYEVKRGSTSLGTTTGTSMGITGLSEATAYSMTVRARDADANWSDWSTPLSVTTADATAPSTPTGLTSPSQTVVSISLSWTASTDNVAVVGYKLYQVHGGTTVTIDLPTTATTYTDTGLAVNATYAYTVKAYDAAGNLSSASSSLSTATLASQADTTNENHLQINAPVSP